MTQKQKIIVFYIIVFLYAIINGLIIFKTESYYFSLLTIALIIFSSLFFALDKVLILSVFFVPLSIPLKTYFPNLDFNIDLPTEPIFVSILLIFLLKQLLEKNYDKKIATHPISILLYFYLAWKFITVLTSTMFFVSLKHWIASLWFIVPFFFILVIIFKDQSRINKFLWMYIISLTIVITITLIKHSAYGFDQKSANWIMNPLYNDHTSYGAALAMYIPILTGFVFNKEFKRSLRIISFILLTYFTLALILSYTRAAWVSLIGAIGVFIILKFKINYKIVIAGILFVGISFFAFQDQIFFMLEGNKQDSSTDFKEHIQSITNVATDASNLERINRWNCAIRMFKEKPIFGWGPGTYQFQYAPFQFSYEKTIISTNAGDMGNAHSEYLGALSEQGLPGMILFIIISLTTFVYAVKNFKRANSYSLKIITASTITGLFTYMIHGFMNNFLDIDKIAVPYWGFTAIIVAVDVYLINQNKEKLTHSNQEK